MGVNGSPEPRRRPGLDEALPPLASGETDLDRIWFREASIETADRFVDTITARFPVLANMPGAGQARGDIEPGLYSFPVEDYIVYYRKGPRGRVLISRIIH